VKLNEHLVLELIVRFEVSMLKGGFGKALQASAGSYENLSVNCF
jgi:hypothetical protein